MKNVKDKYDLSLSSRSGQFGFETFRDDKNGQYYFLFNDMEGEPLLYSQRYQDRKSRDHGLRSVIRNAPLPERQVRETTPEGRHYFMLRAGNNQEIAHSRYFAGEEEMEPCLGLLRQLDENVPVSDWPEEVVSRAAGPPRHSAGAAVPRKKETAEPVEKRPRYRFTVTYYPDSSIWAVVDDFSKASETFQELDGEKIHRFIEHQIPVTVFPAAARSTGEVRLSGSAALTEELERMTIKTRDGGERSHAVRKADLSKVAIHLLPEGVKMKKPLHYDARIVAQTMDRKHEWVIGKVTDRVPDHGTIEVPVRAQPLTAGMYRFVATVNFVEKDKDIQDLISSQIVMVN